MVSGSSGRSVLSGVRVGLGSSGGGSSLVGRWWALVGSVGWLGSVVGTSEVGSEALGTSAVGVRVGEIVGEIVGRAPSPLPSSPQEASSSASSRTPPARFAVVVMTVERMDHLRADRDAGGVDVPCSPVTARTTSSLSGDPDRPRPGQAVGSWGGDNHRTTVDTGDDPPVSGRNEPVTTKSDFAEDEWTRIVRAPFVAGLAITLADPGGPIEAAKETMATMKSASSPPSREQLLTEVALDVQAMAQQRQHPLKGYKPASQPAGEAVLDELREVQALVAAKATPRRPPPSARGWSRVRRRPPMPPRRAASWASRPSWSARVSWPCSTRIREAVGD